MDPLFPQIPEKLEDASADEIKQLLTDSQAAADLIDADDTEFLKGLTGEEIIEQYTAGVEQIKALRLAHKSHEDAYAEFVAKRDELKAAREAEDDDEALADEAAEVVAEAEAITEEEVSIADDVEVIVEPELITASNSASSVDVTYTATVPSPRYSRTPPAPAPDRISVSTVEPKGTALVAAGGYRENFSDALTPHSLAELNKSVAMEYGPAEKNGKKTYIDGPHGRAVFDGPRVKTAKAQFEFPADRILNGGDEDFGKILAKIPSYTIPGLSQGTEENGALTASGGLCAPLTPIYSMPNFGTEAEPVWDSLPVFQAARGGVNVPTATYIADITSAISSISEADDALGGTFATKSCQDLTCPAYTETAIQILAHCREYGNLNARAWPEKIAHENALTMQALARTSEDFMLERIKALSINVTNGVETLGALIYLVDAIVKAKFGIAGRLRMPANARFTALLPSYALDLLLLDTIQTQFDRFRSRGELDAYLRSTGIDPVYYIDGNFAAGDDQLPDSAQTAAAIDGFPNTVQWALYPQGAFLGIDSGSLELGIVRDSTLNSTNDFQVFGERFRNVARIAPAQAAYWITTDWCPSGQFPPAGTARTCE